MDPRSESCAVLSQSCRVGILPLNQAPSFSHAEPKVLGNNPKCRTQSRFVVRHAHGPTFHFELRSYDRSLPFGHQAKAAVIEICHSTKRPASSAPCILRGQPKRPASSALSASCEDSAAHMSQANQTGQTALPGVGKGFAEGHVSACCKIYDPHTPRQTLRKPRSSSARFIGPPTACPGSDRKSGGIN